MDQELHNFLFLKQTYEEGSFAKLYIVKYSVPISIRRPIAVDAPSKTWVCGRPKAVIAGSNTAGGTDVSIF
jgi:hypothetical protein